MVPGPIRETPSGQVWMVLKPGTLHNISFILIRETPSGQVWMVLKPGTLHENIYFILLTQMVPTFDSLCTFNATTRWQKAQVMNMIKKCWRDIIIKDLNRICLQRSKFFLTLSVMLHILPHSNEDIFIKVSPHLGLYSLRRRRLTGIGIPMIDLRRSDDRLRFIMGILILVRRHLLIE